MAIKKKRGRPPAGNGGAVARNLVRSQRWSEREWAEVVKAAGDAGSSEFIRAVVLAAAKRRNARTGKR